MYSSFIVSCALLLSVAINLIKPELKDIKAMLLLSILLILSWRTKKDPLFYILISAIIGVGLSLM